MAKAIEKTQISIRTPLDMIDAFDKIATALDRDRSWVMLRAFRRYLDSEGGDVLREAEAIEALDRGEGIPFDKVMQELSAVVARGSSRKTG